MWRFLEEREKEPAPRGDRSSDTWNDEHDKT
jgi:hypothetical protein